MVPSRSRKTAGRNDAASARSHLRGTHPATCRRLDSLWLNIGHAAVIDRTAPQKTRTAVRLFLYNRAVRSDRRGAVGICRSKNCHNRQADGGGDVHRSRIIAHKKLATRQQRRKKITPEPVGRGKGLTKPANGPGGQHSGNPGAAPPPRARREPFGGAPG